MAYHMRAKVVASLFLLTSLASANDAYWIAVGGAGNFGKSEDVRMLSEHIQIKLFPDRMDVRVDFEFKNEGKAQEVTMAFPETATDYRVRTSKEPVTVTKIWSKVDGLPTPIARKSMKLKDLDEYAQYSAVWLKTVPFATGQRRRVTVEYQAKLSPRDDITLAYYILRSGASWKGKIGQCRVTVDWRGIRNRGEPTFLAADAPISGSRSLASREVAPFLTEITLKDIEPDFDVGFIWENFFWNYRINGQAPPSSYEVTAGGEPMDPWIATDDIYSLLGTEDEYDRADSLKFQPEEVSEVTVRGKLLAFSESSVIVNGKARKLARGLIRKERGHAVYVKDLVAALGGTFNFDPLHNRVLIELPE